MLPFEVTVLSAVSMAAATSGSKRRRCKVHSGMSQSEAFPSARDAVGCTFAPQGNPHARWRSLAVGSDITLGWLALTTETARPIAKCCEG